MPYAINKYVGELYCKYYSEIHKIPNVILRIFNSFGPGELYGKYRNVIPNFIFKALKNEDLHITGTGLETRDFTYIDNTVNLLIKLSESKYYESEVFNSGTGKSISVLLLAETIIKLTKSKSKIIFVPQRSWDHVHNRKSNIYKSENLLNYFPKINLEKDLEKTIEWLKSKI